MKGIQPYIHPSLILLSCWLIFRTSAVSLSSSNVSLRGFMGGVDYVDVGLGGDRPASWLWSPRAYVGLAFEVVSQGGSLISFWMDLGSFKTFHKSHLPFWGRRAWSKQVLKTTVRFLNKKYWRGKYIWKSYCIQESTAISSQSPEIHAECHGKYHHEVIPLPALNAFLRLPRGSDNKITKMVLQEIG